MFTLLNTIKTRFNRLHLLHRWHYRNPYNRVCKVCNEYQVQECYVEDGRWIDHHWSVYREGDLNHK